jgi:hypothetical protein
MLTSMVVMSPSVSATLSVETLMLSATTGSSSLQAENTTQPKHKSIDNKTNLALFIRIKLQY